jgi:hypothetical protein
MRVTAAVRVHVCTSIWVWGTLAHLRESPLHYAPHGAKVHVGHDHPQLPPNHKGGVQQQHMAVLEATQQGCLTNQASLR